MRVRVLHAENLRIPAQRTSAQGESAPKARLRSVVDGKQVNIPVLIVHCEAGTEKARSAGCMVIPV